MDIENTKRMTSELAALLGGELKGSQAFTFRAFCEHVDALVNWHIANTGALSKRVMELENKSEPNEVN